MRYEVLRKEKNRYRYLYSYGYFYLSTTCTYTRTTSSITNPFVGVVIAGMAWQSEPAQTSSNSSMTLYCCSGVRLSRFAVVVTTFTRARKPVCSFGLVD